MELLDDKRLEELWDELEDVLFIEDNERELLLNDKWYIFDRGTYREYIWEWFDENHSKGVGWLMYGR